jgi:hypothetical protein
MQLTVRFWMDWCPAKTSLAACQIDLPLLISWRPFLISWWTPTGWHQLYDLAGKRWRPFWLEGSCLWKRAICPGQMTLCQGQVSRRMHRLLLSLSVADSRWLIDCEIAMPVEGTNYKVHTLFIAACLSIGHKLQSPSNTCIARGQCCSGKF